MYEELEELCEVLEEELREANNKLRGGKLNSGDLDYIDKLTHALKSVTILKEMEDGGNSYADGNSTRRGVRSRDNASNRSYRRRRDSMGRYSGDEDVMSELENMASNTTDPQTKSEIKRLMRDMNY